MANIWTMGEILVEVMRPEVDMPLDVPGIFRGPFPSGAPAIFIDTVARLNHGAGIIGGVGADDFGDCVLNRLQTDGVDCHLVRRYADSATAVAFVTYFSDGSRRFLYHINRTSAVMTGYNPGDIVETPDFFHVMGCSLMANDDFQRHIFRAVEDLHSRGARISFDPNIRPELLGSRSLAELVGPVLERCSVLLPGQAELALLSGQNSVDAAVQHMFAAYPLDYIVLKRGRHGSAVYARSGEVLEQGAYPVEEIDPTGAGDCFDAGFLCAMLEGLGLPDCLRVASAAGALNAAAFGPMEGKISRQSVGEVLARGAVLSD